jgi:hypothetical protein
MLRSLISQLAHYKMHNKILNDVYDGCQNQRQAVTPTQLLTVLIGLIDDYLDVVITIDAIDEAANVQDSMQTILQLHQARESFREETWKLVEQLFETRSAPRSCACARHGRGERCLRSVLRERGENRGYLGESAAHKSLYENILKRLCSVGFHFRRRGCGVLRADTLPDLASQNDAQGVMV